MRVLPDHDRRDAVARARERQLSRLALWLGAPVLFAALVLSYSRASLVNLFVALAALLYLERARLRIGRLLAIAASCLAAGSLVAWQLFPEAAWNYWLRLLHSQFCLLADRRACFPAALASWQTIAAFLAAHPWHAILGIGYKTLPYSDFIGQNIVADNMYLSLLVETGIVGLAAFFLLNFAILRTAWRAARRHDSRASFFGTWIFCFWIGQLFQMLSGDLFTYWRVLPVVLLGSRDGRAASRQPMSAAPVPGSIQSARRRSALPARSAAGVCPGWLRNAPGGSRRRTIGGWRAQPRSRRCTGFLAARTRPGRRAGRISRDLASIFRVRLCASRLWSPGTESI